MNPVRIIEGCALPIARSDIDTDQILPAHWLTRIERTGFAAGCFEAWRRDPASILNAPEHRGARILIAGPNFGCGSSREHAVWALLEYGIGAVIAPSFAGIFRENALNAGLLTLELPVATTQVLMTLARTSPDTRFTIDLSRLEVRAGSACHPFVLAPLARERLLEGRDAIAQTLTRLSAIQHHESQRPAWMPRPAALAP